MSTPLEKLLTSGGAIRVGAENADPFCARAGWSLLLITGDVAQRPEAQDVAVIAAELARSIHGLVIGVVDPDAEPVLKARFNVAAVPAVILLKNGRAISTVARVQPWHVYARAAEVVFGRQEAKL